MAGGFLIIILKEILCIVLRQHFPEEKNDICLRHGFRHHGAKLGNGGIRQEGQDKGTGIDIIRNEGTAADSTSEQSFIRAYLKGTGNSADIDVQKIRKLPLWGQFGAGTQGAVMNICLQCFGEGKIERLFAVYEGWFP